MQPEKPYIRSDNDGECSLHLSHVWKPHDTELSNVLVLISENFKFGYHALNLCSV